MSNWKLTLPGEISEVKMATGYFKFLNKLFDLTKWDISFVF